MTNTNQAANQAANQAKIEKTALDQTTKPRAEQIEKIFNNTGREIILILPNEKLLLIIDYKELREIDLKAAHIAFHLKRKFEEKLFENCQVNDQGFTEISFEEYIQATAKPKSISKAVSKALQAKYEELKQTLTAQKLDKTTIDAILQSSFPEIANANANLETQAK